LINPSETRKKDKIRQEQTGRAMQAYLLETNVVGVFTETLTAQIDTVLPD